MQGPILVTGATGLLGGMLVWRWGCRWPSGGVAALVRSPQALPAGAWPGVKVVTGDLIKPETLAPALAEVRPSLVVNCAAFTKVDPAEDQPELARAINVDGAGALAAAAREAGAALVHISTDAVYAEGEKPHTEDQAGGPMGVYARTKLDGEGAVLAAHPQALVLRTCMFGWNQNPALSSLAEWVIASLSAGQAIKGFTDVSFNPLHTPSLADLILAGEEAKLSGVYNLGAADGVSKYDFAVMVARSMRLNLGLISRASQAEVALKAPRPTAPLMDSSRFYTAVGQSPPRLSTEVTRFASLGQTGGLTSFRRFGGYA